MRSNSGVSRIPGQLSYKLGSGCGVGTSHTENCNSYCFTKTLTAATIYAGTRIGRPSSQALVERQLNYANL